MAQAANSVQSFGETTWTSTTAPPALTSLTPRNGRMMEKLRGGLEEYVRLFNPVASNWRSLTRNVERERRRNIDRRKMALAGRHSSIPEVSRYNRKLEPLEVPHLDILHSDNESDDDVTSPRVLRDVKTFRSLPNMTHRSGLVVPPLAPPLVGNYATSELSTISSVDVDVSDDASFYSARRDHIRSTLQLMGGSSLANKNKPLAPARTRASKVTTKRKRSARKRTKTMRSRDVSGSASNSDLASSKLASLTSSTNVDRKPPKAPLDVIAEAHVSPETRTPATSPSKARKSASTSKSGDVTSSVDESTRGGSSKGFA